MYTDHINAGLDAISKVCDKIDSTEKNERTVDIENFASENGAYIKLNIQFDGIKTKIVSNII